MTAEMFKERVRRAGFLPGAFVQYLLVIADALKPESRTRIAQKLEAGESAALLAATDAVRKVAQLQSAKAA